MRRRLSRVALAVVMAGACVAVAASGVPAPGSTRASRERAPGLQTAFVARSDIESTLTVGGDIGSTRFTMVTCEVENVSGKPLTVLWVVKEGTHVKKDDPLCRLDSSEFEEQVRLQEIEWERSRAELRQAELELKTARTALIEYRDGQVELWDKEFRTKISLAESELSRAEDRRRWSEGMLAVHYLSRAEAAGEATTRLRAGLELAKLRGEYRAFRKYTVPKNLMDLQTKIAAAEKKLEAATLAAESQESRLARYRRQVERCTIRAPHDGVAVYFDFGWGEENRLREGLQIFQGRPLFSLPDLSTLTVNISIHESVIDRVKVGMPARVVMPAFPGRVFEGKVAMVTQLPQDNWRVGPDVKHFLGEIKLGAMPDGVMPNMSAGASIVAERRPGVLAVPVEAITYEEGRPACDVIGPDGLERREVRLGLAGRDRVEIVGGLAEGEEVAVWGNATPTGASALESTTAGIPFGP